ncbi:hypothetical protein Avbf_03578 [Armadillidium vulgare]|nr:hypothetical protein Avbf_03578 [Armadillidium vulgare]
MQSYIPITLYQYESSRILYIPILIFKSFSYFYILTTYFVPLSTEKAYEPVIFDAHQSLIKDVFKNSMNSFQY